MAPVFDFMVWRLAKERWKRRGKTRGQRGIERDREERREREEESKKRSIKRVDTKRQIDKVAERKIWEENEMERKRECA